jgi:hypothetical protein
MIGYLTIFFSIRFESTERHARQSVQLRGSGNVLAFPQYFRGNASLGEDAITTVAELYQEDGISRVSSNSKDVIQINGKTVAVRLIEMTVLNAFREFDQRHPGLVGRSAFHYLRPRNVKIASPHETCMCIYHENMHLLLQVYKLITVSLLQISKFSYSHGTKTTNEYGRNLLHQLLTNLL